jgi:hypothetical protein
MAPPPPPWSVILLQHAVQPAPQLKTKGVTHMYLGFIALWAHFQRRAHQAGCFSTAAAFLNSF